MGTGNHSKPRNLPRTFAFAGIAIGCLLALVHWLDYAFNPFDFPTLLIFILCPGQLLHLFTIGIGGPLVWFVWLLGVLLNGPIYFLIGLLVGRIKASWRLRA